MRKQFLWVRKAGFNYLAPGNINVGPGSKGTIFFWFHLLPVSSNNQTIWEITADSNNWMKLGFDGVSRLSFKMTAGGTGYTLQWTGFDPTQYNFWMPVTCTWDFTTPGQGKLRLYVDGQEAVNQVNTANGLTTAAQRLYLGPRTEDSSSALDGCFDNFAVWDGVMSKAQHDTLKAGAADYSSRLTARRRSIRESDSSGVLTLLADFDGQYDARIAGGDATAYWQVGSADYDQFCRLDDGSRGRGERYRFFFGKPRHDNSDDDRVPLNAVLSLIRTYGSDQFTTVTNHATHSQLTISALKAVANQGQGLGWLREFIDPGNLLRPATIRMRVNVPNATNVIGTKMSLGPLCYVHGGMHGSNFGTWGTGEAFAVVADAGNTAQTFKTNLGVRAANYWTGAELSFKSGGNSSCRLKVASYDPATSQVTLQGSLPGVPVAADQGFVDFRGRLMPNAAPPIETQSMEAWLWEEWGEDRPWIELECSYGTSSGTSFTRYERGRTMWMDLPEIRSGAEGKDLMFGRNRDYGMPASYSCDILIESLIIEGPGHYQVMGEADSLVGRGFELGDEFMTRDMRTGHSSRVWRWQNTQWGAFQPTLNPSAPQVTADMSAAGTWRETALFYNAVIPAAPGNKTTALVRGLDAGGVARYGYLQAEWDEQWQRIRWTEESAPAGRSNPFISNSDLPPWLNSDSTWGLGKGPSLLQIIGTADGKWSLLFGGNEDNPDHYITRALHGAPDRWSFDRGQQWWPENPLVPGIGGVDKLSPDAGNLACFGNRDSHWIVAHNPYAREAGRRYLGYARFKTIMPLDAIGTNRRPLAGWTSPDLRSFFLLPHGNMISPIAATEVFNPRPYAVSDDFVGMLVEFYGGVIRLWASDDDRHFQNVFYNYLPSGGPLDAYLVGDKRVFHWHTSGVQNYGWVGRNREAGYELGTTASSGWLETAALERPAGGWSDLLLNVNPAGGSVRVEVRDAITEAPLAGFGADDCDEVEGGLEQRITWGGLSLRELSAERIQLRFYLERTSSGEPTPQVFGWHIQAAAHSKPSASGLTVEGRMNPTGVSDPSPTFGWSYHDDSGKPQRAYHLLVASSPEKLGQNQGDLWDSGVVVSSASEVVYNGQKLQDSTTYFWKVRVQNCEGAWSLEW
jgi:hypothetical protein